MNKAFKLDKGNDSLHSVGGIYLAGQSLKTSQITEVFENQKRANLQFQDVDLLKSQIGLLVQGRERYTDIGQFRDNEVFMKSLEINGVASEETLRQRLEKMPITHNELLKQANLQLLKKRNLGTITKAGMTFIPLDMDVSPLDNSQSKKEFVGWTYKGHDGYAPMFSYIGSEGFMLSNELRPESQHSQKGMPQFLDENFEFVKQLKLDHSVLLRLDSAHDAEINFDHLPAEHNFIIKRNLRRENRGQWLAMARAVGRKLDSREGKNIYVGEVHHKRPGNKKDRAVVPVIFKVTEITIDSDGNPLLIPEVNVDTYWTNLPLEAQEIIELYQDHATSEQYHSELKTDMNVERLPSGKFAANQIYLNCSMLAFNILRVIGTALIKYKSFAPVKITVQRRRLRSIIRDLIFIACKHVKHAHDETLKFGRSSPWFDVYKKISISL